MVISRISIMSKVSRAQQIQPCHQLLFMPTTCKQSCIHVPTTLKEKIKNQICHKILALGNFLTNCHFQKFNKTKSNHTIPNLFSSQIYIDPHYLYVMVPCLYYLQLKSKCKIKICRKASAQENFLSTAISKMLINSKVNVAWPCLLCH